MFPVLNTDTYLFFINLKYFVCPKIMHIFMPPSLSITTVLIRISQNSDTLTECAPTSNNISMNLTTESKNNFKSSLNVRGYRRRRRTPGRIYQTQCKKKKVWKKTDV